MSRIALLIVALTVLSAILLSAVVPAAEGKPKHQVKKCGYCGMDASVSPTHVTATYKVKGKKAVLKDFVSLGCYMRVAMINPPPGTYSDVKILDYATFKAEEQKFVAVEGAWYVPLKSLDGSMPPYFAGFADKKAAKEFAVKNDSRVLDFNETHKLIMKEIMK